MKALHCKNAVELLLTEEIGRKHPTFPVTLLKLYKESDPEKFPLRNKLTTQMPPFEDASPSPISKILSQKKTRVRNNDLRMYLVRFKGKTHAEDKWLEEKDIPDASILLRKWRVDKRS